MDNSGLAQLMAASVVGSVSYSLWASRFGARTRQLLMVTCASLSWKVKRGKLALLVHQDIAMKSHSNIVDIKEEVCAKLFKAKNIICNVVGEIKVM